jgi:hypothetical protein
MKLSRPSLLIAYMVRLRKRAKCCRPKQRVWATVGSRNGDIKTASFELFFGRSNDDETYPFFSLSTWF